MESGKLSFGCVSQEIVAATNNFQTLHGADVSCAVRLFNHARFRGRGDGYTLLPGELEDR